jgi:hypothetical protein
MLGYAIMWVMLDVPSAAGVVEVMNSSHEEDRFTLIVDDCRSLEVGSNEP